jgi:GNAT superfamily N-acetyltransferase
MTKHDDALWEARFFRLRLMAEDGAGHVVAFGEVEHMPWQFHDHKYALHVAVDPAFQGRGYGSAIYRHLEDALRRRGAVLARASVKESMTRSVEFLRHRGFDEIQRSWESRLDVPRFDFSAFAGAEERVSRAGIVLTTVAAERPRNPDLLRQVYALEVECSRDEPSYEPITPAPFELWVKDSFEAPNVIPDGMFLARDGERYVGLSFLYRRLAQAEVLQQGFTCVDREYRGKGIAMALKLRTAQYARDHGYQEIRTWNNTRNRPMLRINEAMGFAKQPAWVELAKPFGA